MNRDEWRWWLVVDENGNIIDGFNSHDGAEGYLEEHGADSDWTWVKVREDGNA